MRNPTATGSVELGTPVPGTTPGGIDGFLAQFDASGNRTWTRQLGTTAEDQLWGVAADAAGNATVSGFTAGDLFAPNAGDKDIVVARFDPTGAITLNDQLGSIGNDKGTNVALDLNGQARLWLGYAAEIEGKGRTEDQLAFFRDAHEFRNLLLVEQANGDFAMTIARQFYFDVWHSWLLKELLYSSDQRIREVSEKARKEVQYHLRRSAGWVIRLGDGTDHRRAAPPRPPDLRSPEPARARHAPHHG